jgi:hypothetical protein
MSQDEYESEDDAESLTGRCCNCTTAGQRKLPSKELKVLMNLFFAIVVGAVFGIVALFKYWSATDYTCIQSILFVTTFVVLCILIVHRVPTKAYAIFLETDSFVRFTF